jgi:hypothetical protein
LFCFVCIINFTLAIFLSLSLPPSLSVIFLCYNPLFSPPTTLSAPSYPLSPHLHFPLLSFPSLLQHYSSLLLIHNLLTSLLNNCTHPQPPAIPDTAFCTTKVEIHPNTHKDHKIQQLPYLFPHPDPLLELCLSNTQVSISSLTTIIPSPTPTVYRQYHQRVFYIICKQLAWH